ncbi:universal stress protein [Bradyrhizobium sp. AZCC 2289]|uniref:universal stress protein n=1 Tax=Bradyrhizobium sp. AZCC 2289 TaxID=3117026 RepID=UPI003FA5F630
MVELAKELKVEPLVIGATGHSALYDRLIGSRADRIVQLAHCPVLVNEIRHVAYWYETDVPSCPTHVR